LELVGAWWCLYELLSSSLDLGRPSNCISRISNNSFVNLKSARNTFNMAIAPPLGTSWGYGIILGLGSLFALGMVNFIPHHNIYNLTAL
jgi:hypothetical protein